MTPHNPLQPPNLNRHFDTDPRIAVLFGAALQGRQDPVRWPVNPTTSPCSTAPQAPSPPKPQQGRRGLHTSDQQTAALGLLTLKRQIQHQQCHRGNRIKKP